MRGRVAERGVGLGLRWGGGLLPHLPPLLLLQLGLVPPPPTPHQAWAHSSHPPAPAHRRRCAPTPPPSCIGSTPPPHRRRISPAGADDRKGEGWLEASSGGRAPPTASQPCSPPVLLPLPPLPPRNKGWGGRGEAFSDQNTYSHFDWLFQSANQSANKAFWTDRWIKVFIILELLNP